MLMLIDVISTGTTAPAPASPTQMGHQVAGSHIDALTSGLKETSLSPNRTSAPAQAPVPETDPSGPRRASPVQDVAMSSSPLTPPPTQGPLATHGDSEMDLDGAEQEDEEEEDREDDEEDGESRGGDGPYEPSQQVPQPSTPIVSTRAQKKRHGR
jgi:hypothetical protein